MGKEGNNFRTNPEKAISKISINAFMIGSLFMILTIIWTLSPEKFSPILIFQLVLAIPLLFVSSLAYSKVGYWKETRLWDKFGWITHNTGNILVFNTVGLMASTFSLGLALSYFVIFIALMFVYSLINVIYNPHLLKNKILKFLFFAIVMFLGGILPLLL